MTPICVWAQRVVLPPDQGGCWIWAGWADRYGSFKIGSKNVYAHRFAFEQFVGPIPDGLEIDHLCRNPLCVNPSHLEAVSHWTNVRRVHGDTCKHGHQLDEQNTYWDKPRFSNRLGARKCRVCHRTRQARYRAAARGVAA